MLRSCKSACGAVALFSLAASLTLSAHADKKQPVKPIAGPRATALRVSWLYVSPASDAQKVDRVQIGREMVVAERSGKWLRVYANTDVEEQSQKDAPLIGENEVTPPISGWMEARGVVVESTPNGDLILLGEAANQESLASDPRGPIHAARNARLLYRRLAELFPASSLAPEAAWRAADILWQLQKTDNASMPSSHEKESWLRPQIDDEELRKILKLYPHTRQAALAAFDLLDNKLCGDWQDSIKCPAKESEEYEKYAAEYSDGPRAAQALYLATYRQAALTDILAADNNESRSKSAHEHARELAARLKEKFPQSDFTARAQALVFKLDEGIPVYGIDRQ